MISLLNSGESTFETCIGRSSLLLCRLTSKMCHVFDDNKNNIIAFNVKLSKMQFLFVGFSYFNIWTLPMKLVIQKILFLYLHAISKNRFIMLDCV